MSNAAQAIANVVALTDNRGADYGHPIDDFRRAAALKDVVTECPDPELRHVMEMICVKLARLIHSPNHLDSWCDIAGYARTAGMVMDRRAEIEHPDDEGI